MRPVLLFDGDCGFCTMSADVLRRWVRPAADIVPWQHADIDSYGLTSGECSAAVQFVLGDGSVRSGSRAMAAVLCTAPMPWPVLGRLAALPGVDAVADRAYRWIAAHRHRLPGSTQACAIAG